MVFTKCCVCHTTAAEAKLFNFPRSNSIRTLWLEHALPKCLELGNLTKEQLQHRKVCIKHFEQKYLRGTNRVYFSCPTLFTDEEISTGQPSVPAIFEGKPDHTYNIVSKDHMYHKPEKRKHECEIITGNVPTHKRPHIDDESLPIIPSYPSMSKTAVQSSPKPEKKQMDHTYSRKRHYDHSYFKPLKSHQEPLIDSTNIPSTSHHLEHLEVTAGKSDHSYTSKHWDHSYCATAEKRSAVRSINPVVPDLYTILIQEETDQESLPDIETDAAHNELVQKQHDTVQKQNDIVQEKRQTIQKQKYTSILQKAMMHAELSVISDNELLMEEEYTMYMDDDDPDDGDADHHLLYSDDVNKDVHFFVQDTELQIIGDDVVIETEPQEETSFVEVCDGTHVPQSSETTEPQAVQYGQCRCCLEMGTHTVLDVIHELECFNMPVATDPRLSRLVCSACGKFLQEARRFRDMAAASQNLLLDNLTDGDVKYPSVWANPSGVTAAHDDECERELMYIQQQADVKYPSVWADPSSVTAAHDDEFERELMDIRQQAVSVMDREASPTLEMTDHGGIQDEMSDDKETKVDIGMPDDGNERPVFSRLSDYPDAQMGTEVNYENLSDKDFKEMVQADKKKRAKFSTHIRQNLIMILDYSTVLPFLSITGETFECIYCDGTFNHIDQLRAHVEESHRNEETDFKHDILKLLPEMILFVDVSSMNCRLCDKQFTTIDNLVQHLVEMHKKKYHNLCLDPPHNIVPFNLSLDVPQCVECGKTFPDYKKLRLHVIKHYGPFLCHQCGSKFLHLKLYHQHILTHQDYNKIKQTCDECGVNFRNKKLLSFHYYENHYDIIKKQIGQSDMKESAVNLKEETRDIAYECTLCENGTTSTLTAAYMHRIGHLKHTREGPYSCEVCGHMSPVKKEFRAHLQGHYGIKKYACEVCKKTFKKNSQLSDHMSVHLNLRFHCPLCDTTLNDKKRLMRHVKNQHSDLNVAFSL